MWPEIRMEGDREHFVLTITWPPEGRPTAPPAPGQVVSYAQAAEVLGITVRTVKARIARGELSKTLTGRRHRNGRREFGVVLPAQKGRARRAGE
jgi:excisionase family DNA binding protein